MPSRCNQTSSRCPSKSLLFKQEISRSSCLRALLAHSVLPSTRNSSCTPREHHVWSNYPRRLRSGGRARAERSLHSRGSSQPSAAATSATVARPAAGHGVGPRARQPCPARQHAASLRSNPGIKIFIFLITGLPENASLQRLFLF